MNMQQLSDILNQLSTIGTFRLIVIVLIIIIVAATFVYKWYISTKPSEISKRIEELSLKIDDHDEWVEKHISHMQTEMISILRDIRDRQVGAINKQDSLRIIIDKFNNMTEEIKTVFEWSITKNDYNSRKSFIKKKIKTELARVISVSENSLTDFKLTVDLTHFFKRYLDEKDNTTKYTIVDDLWDGINQLYVSDESLTNRLEEMRINVSNIVTIHLTKAQAGVNELYKEDEDDD